MQVSGNSGAAAAMQQVAKASETMNQIQQMALDKTMGAPDKQIRKEWLPNAREPGKH